MKRILMFVVSVCIGTALADEFVLIDKGESDYVIAIPSSASKYERFAAGELALHLEKMAGIRLAVAEEDTLKPGKKVISIGGTSFSKKAGIDRSKLQDEEIVIRTTAEGNLILSGGRLRGTMYAVYDFLEKQLGCHWFDEYTFAIPEKKRIVIPELNLQYRPYFMFRRVSASIPVDRTAWQIFILRNQGSDDPYLCGYDLIGSPIACHSFEYYAKNFQEGDVEFYAMNEKGIRQKPAGSSGPDFCLTNPGVIKNVTASLKKYILQDRARYAQYGFPPPLIYDISHGSPMRGYGLFKQNGERTPSFYALDFFNRACRNGNAVATESSDPDTRLAASASEDKIPLMASSFKTPQDQVKIEFPGIRVKPESRILTVLDYTEVPRVINQDIIRHENGLTFEKSTGSIIIFIELSRHG